MPFDATVLYTEGFDSSSSATNEMSRHTSMLSAVTVCKVLAEAGYARRLD